MSNADSGFLQRGEIDSINRGVAQQRDLSGETRLAPLADELHTQSARIEHVDGVGVGGAQLCQLGLEVELIEGSVDLLQERLLVLALEAGDEILAGLIVRSHGVDALVALRSPRSGPSLRRADRSGRRPGSRTGCTAHRRSAKDSRWSRSGRPPCRRPSCRSAIMMFEKVTPVMIGTRSLSISLSTTWLATSGLSWLSSRRI